MDTGRKSWILAAVTGLIGGLNGCGGASTPAPAAPETAPAEAKHGCSGGKASCGGAMPDDQMPANDEDGAAPPADDKPAMK